VWDKLIQGFVLALIWMYKVLGSSEWSLVLSITFLTIAVRVITIPLTVPSQRSMKKNSARMQALQPELDKLKQRYGNDRQKLQEAQLRLYQEHGINPVASMTGCLPMFIQLPIIWAFYQSISRALANQPGQMLALTRYLSAVPGFMNLVPLPSKWLWFDLARPDMLLLPILVAGSTWLQQKLTVPASAPSSDAQSAQMQQSMTVTMPLMFGFFAMQMPAGLSIYFIASNLVGMGIQWLTNRLLKDDETEAKTSPPKPATSSKSSAARSPSSVTRASREQQQTVKKRGYRKREPQQTIKKRGYRKRS
jgi:YidC/Oxa1 family membrane protein insertase